MGTHHGSKLTQYSFTQFFPSEMVRLLINILLTTTLALHLHLHATVLELSGLNLQIADAARKSGFDTRHHVALLDLIWSVRRVAFSYGVTKPSLLRPPKHPIYPDRHRPGTQGSKSKRSRKRTREAAAEAQTHGTSSNPVDLDADGSDTDNKPLILAGSKRRKSAFGLIVNPTDPSTTSSPLNPIHPSRFPNSRLSTIKAEGKENIPPTRSTYKPSPHSLNVPLPRHSPYAPRFHSLALAPANSGRQLRPFQPRYPLQAFSQPEETLYELRCVSQTLSDNLDAMKQCQRAMKTLYDADDQIRHADIFDQLVKLRNDMEDSENGNLKALGGVDQVIGFLKSGGRHGAIGMDEID
jgi:hypothetical protein